MLLRAVLFCQPVALCKARFMLLECDTIEQQASLSRTNGLQIAEGGLQSTSKISLMASSLLVFC